MQPVLRDKSPGNQAQFSGRGYRVNKHKNRLTGYCTYLVKRLYFILMIILIGKYRQITSLHLPLPQKPKQKLRKIIIISVISESDNIRLYPLYPLPSSQILQKSPRNLISVIIVIRLILSQTTSASDKIRVRRPSRRSPPVSCSWLRRLRHHRHNGQ